MKYTLLILIFTVGCAARHPVGPDASVPPTYYSSQIPCGTSTKVLAVITEPMCQLCTLPEPDLHMKPTGKGYQCMTGRVCEKLHPVGPVFFRQDVEKARKFCFSYEEGKS